MQAADKGLQTADQFYLALDDFMAWMEGADNSFNRLADETAKQEVLQNSDLCKLYLEEFRVSPLLLSSVVYIYNVLPNKLCKNYFYWILLKCCAPLQSHVIIDSLKLFQLLLEVLNLNMVTVFLT